MKISKIILSIITIIFAILGLVRIIPFNIANPITLASMSTVILLSSIELKANNNKTGFKIMLVISIFVYIFVFYTIL